MRRATKLAFVLTTSLALGATALGLAPAATAAPSPVDKAQFGMHVPGIANGTVPSVSYGSVRLWDSGVAWPQIEKAKGDFWWTPLDQAVQAANAQGLQITYVLGSTPTWAATNKKQSNFLGKGAASMPNMNAWRTWVSAVVERYGPSIESYQIWNEANLPTFFQGTPKQMAQLTREAARIIRAGDPTAKIVSASTTIRLTSAYQKFFPKYLNELRKAGWPIDVVAVHTYGPSKETPALREDYIIDARQKMAKAGASRFPLWDTEVNYGIKGPSKKDKDQDIEGTQAASWVVTTYLDSVRLGVERTHWYFWSAPIDLLGVQVFNGTTGAAGYQTAYQWLAGAWATCGTEKGVNFCDLDKGSPARVAWTDKGTASFAIPSYATKRCDVLNSCTPVTPGSTVTIGTDPAWFGN